MTDSSQPPKVEMPITIENADLAWFGMDESNPVAPELMGFCAAVLRAIAPSPERVQLVVTGDFVASVRKRSITEHQQQNYDVARSSGVVGAKTMPRPDGTIDVITPAWWFMGDDDPAVVLEREAMAKRTIAHEAFHVAMEQAGEAECAYEHEPWARQNMLAIADSVIAEYRAESAVNPSLRNNPDLAWDPVELITHLRDALGRIAKIEYQAHLDVSRLVYDVGQECSNMWKAMAYLVVQQLNDGDSIEPLSDDATSDLTWSQMVGDHWARFTAILLAIPRGNVRVERNSLEPSVEALADEFFEWLETFGFRWRDTTDGDTEFLIVNWRFLA